MRITNVRAIQPVAANSPPDWRTTFGQILVAVDTDCGLTGYGVGGGGVAALPIVRTVLRDVLLGQDAERIDPLWQAMYRATLPFGRKGIAIMALSGVDLALWDLRGRAARLPVACLLGGRTGVPIPTYATCWDRIAPAEAERYRAFKLHLGQLPGEHVADDVEQAVSAARKVIGPKSPLMLDAWMRWDLASTLEIARRLERWHIDWIEEPLPVDDVAGYEHLRDACPIPIAGGEHEFTAFGFRDVLERRLHRIVQPDVCWCGGLTELIKIYQLADAAGLRVCPHRGAEVWGLHAIAALDRQPLAESGRPWMTWVGGQPPIEDGLIQLGDAPGFGVVIDEDYLPMAAH